MLTATEHAASNVLWLDDYRHRNPGWHWDDDGPPPLGARKACDDTLLSETVLVDAAASRRYAA
jgi:hypothetical protein